MLTWPGARRVISRRCLCSASASISSCSAVTLQLSLTRLQICFQLSVTHSAAPALRRGSLCLPFHPCTHPPLPQPPSLCCPFYLLRLCGCLLHRLSAKTSELSTLRVSLLMSFFFGLPRPFDGWTSRAGDTCASTAALLTTRETFRPQSETVDNQWLQSHWTAIHLSWRHMCMWRLFQRVSSCAHLVYGYTINHSLWRTVTHIHTHTHTFQCWLIPFCIELHYNQSYETDYWCQKIRLDVVNTLWGSFDRTSLEWLTNAVLDEWIGGH